MKERVQILSHLEHVLKRPDSYVGSTSLQDDLYWVLQPDESLKQENLRYSPALLKIFDEILVNAIDRNSMYPSEVTKIEVCVTPEGTIQVINNGPLGGISVEKHQTEDIWNPQLTFGHLLTSTNYNDDDQRVVGGRNGYGAKLTNIYSTLFSVHILDAENHLEYAQDWTNNMRNVTDAKVTKFKGTKSQVTIKFTPDWKLFGMKGPTEDIRKIIQKRVWDAAACTSSKCKVKYQDQLVEVKSLEAYVKMHLGSETKMAVYTSERWSVVVAVGEPANQVSFVNGICTTKGGTHVDHVLNILAHGIQEELGKKAGKLTLANIKSTLFVFVKATLVNPTFSSQVKSECTLKVQEFGSIFEPTSSFVKNVLKTGVQDELLALSKFKEQKELKKTDGNRRSNISGIPKLDDANFAGTSKGSKCTLIITEGDSAKTLAIAGLAVVGRDLYGVFPLRGKCKNVRDASVAQLLANEEFSNLKKILGLQQDKVYTTLDQLRYGRLMIMTDADNDGSHIKGLILNMFHYFWPSLLELNFIVSLVTPIIKATKGSEVKSFYTEATFRDWYQGATGNWKIKYYKGLGTSTSAEAQVYFKNIDRLTVKFQPDPKATDSIVLAFDKTKADDRKNWILENTAVAAQEIDYGNVQKLTVSDFVHKDLIHFSLADLRRSVASMVDGLKPSQRKVLFACLSRNLVKDEIKVAQLAAYVAERTSYHHGEVSLADTIVKLAHDFTGSNNINLLEPCGQFGTRLMGGKDSSQTRYIFTKLGQKTRTLFDSKDDHVLKYLDDDGKSIEPEYYVPIIPTVLVNGTEGIGTGFSSYVPPFNPDDIRDNITRALSGQSLKKMQPWFRGFKGTTETKEDGVWITRGIYKQIGGTIHVTELPPERWTQDFKEYLDQLQEKKTISGYENNSTTEQVNFLIHGYQGNDPIKDFKLEKTIRSSNMHLFHPTKGIKKYSSAEDILVDFVEIRVSYYQKRKESMVSELRKNLTLIENRQRFIELVMNEKLPIFRRSKSDICSDLLKNKFKEDTHDYLLATKTYEYTRESVDKLSEEVCKTQETLSILQKTSILDLWKNDLSTL